MITPRVSQRARSRVLLLRRPTGSRHFAPVCESLETRQLLTVSAFPPTSMFGAIPGSIVVQPSVSLISSVSTQTPAGLSPAQVRNAYDVNSISLGGSIAGTGAGQTIAIIDAYNDPNIAADLSKFDLEYGLSAPPTLTQYVESGVQSNNANWALETSLDVEWAHAIAPQASIDLVEANPDTTDLFNAVGFASGLPGVSVVSMSFGTSEFSDESAYDSLFTTPTGHGGVTFVASSGDSSSVQYPSSSPNVLAVGGTTLNVTINGTYTSESQWSASGGGASFYEPEPNYQAQAQSSNTRTIPDVAWDANPATGVAVYDSLGTGSSPWQVVGGTSVGAPSWSGLIAIADQGLTLAGRGPLTNSQLGTDLYSTSLRSAFNVVSALNETGASNRTATGLGSPKADVLIPALVARLSTGSLPVTSSSGVSRSSIPLRPLDVNLILTSPFTVNESGSTSTASSNSSITPLTPTILAAYSFHGREVIVVIVIPQPLVANLGASSAPVTTQSILATVASEESAATPTRFGQGTGEEFLDLDPGHSIEVEPQAPAGIDFIEPFQPIAPAKVPEKDVVAPPNATRVRSKLDSSELWFNTVTTVEDPVFPLNTRLDTARWLTDDRMAESHPSWAPSSTIIGAAALALGSYHLALRQSNRFSGRWVPGRSNARRMSGRFSPVLS